MLCTKWHHLPGTKPPFIRVLRINLKGVVLAPTTDGALMLMLLLSLTRGQERLLLMGSQDRLSLIGSQDCTSQGNSLLLTLLHHLFCLFEV